MFAEIISIGNELLSGNQNTNASWIAYQLSINGISVKKIHTIGDNKKDIFASLDVATKSSKIVIITGGLGPTKDDMTKLVLCRFYKCDLKFSNSAYNHIEQLFKTRGLTVTLTNKKQAEVPEKAKPIPNIMGTAPGLWFETDDNILIAMPGVPYEMKTMFDNFILPEIKLKYKLPYYYSRTILTQGIGESFLSDIITDWEKSIPSFIKLAYLPSPGIVKLRLTGSSDDKISIENHIEQLISNLKEIIPQYIYGYDNQKLEEIIGAKLIDNNATISIAESCTGGYISHLFTSCPGSSEYFIGGITAYANAIKTNKLKIDNKVLMTYGAVSSEVVSVMASNVRKQFKTTYGLATTGIAGPAGGTPQKPVGTVWIAIATPKQVITEKFLFGENRMLNITKTAITALNMLRKEIENNTTTNF